MRTSKSSFSPTISKTRRGSLERTCQWVYSQEIAPDVTVVITDSKFSLHKIPLVSKSGYIMRLVADAEESDVKSIELTDFPGGAATFQDVAKFCYGIDFEINPDNAPALWCAAEMLRMTEDFAPNNLVKRVCDYLERAVERSLPCAVAALQACQGLPSSSKGCSEIIEGRCVEAIATIAVSEFQHNTMPGRSRDWWAQELCVVPITSFAKLIHCMKAKGLPGPVIGSVLMTYSESWLSSPDLVDIKGFIEGLTMSLPKGRSCLSVTFLCGLLNTAWTTKGSVDGACIYELEARISEELEQATHHDLLLVSPICSDGYVSHLDSLRRIVARFLDTRRRRSLSVPSSSISLGSYSNVGQAVDGYLGVIATAEKLSVEDFVSLPKVIAGKVAREVEDGLYRAIDIYLKAHPHLDELGREKVCSILDAHRLSRDARTHASQNKRLPLTTVLQALYHDQMKLRSNDIPKSPSKPPVADAAAAAAVVALYKENEELKKQMAHMKAMMGNNKQVVVVDAKAQEGQSQAKKRSLLAAVARGLGLGRLRKNWNSKTKDTNSLIDSEESPCPPLAPRRRRFSIS